MTNKAKPRRQIQWILLILVLIVVVYFFASNLASRRYQTIIERQGGSIMFEHHEDSDRLDFRGHWQPNGGPASQETRRDSLQHWLPFVPGKSVAVDFEHQTLDIECLKAIAAEGTIERLSFTEVSVGCVATHHASTARTVRCVSTHPTITI